MTKPKNSLKKIPTFRTEDEEREFWANADSTEYVDWSKSESVRFPSLRLTPRNDQAPPGGDVTPS